MRSLWQFCKDLGTILTVLIFSPVILAGWALQIIVLLWRLGRRLGIMTLAERT